MGRNNLRDGRVKNWFYLENDLLDREDLNTYGKTVYIVIARYVNGENKAFPSYETIVKKGSMAKIQAKQVVNDAGHLPMEEQPWEVNREILEFLSDLEKYNPPHNNPIHKPIKKVDKNSHQNIPQIIKKINVIPKYIFLLIGISKFLSHFLHIAIFISLGLYFLLHSKHFILFSFIVSYSFGTDLSN